MHKFLMLLVFAVVIKSTKAQSSFSFNCTKDTTILCTSSCISLITTIPDIHALTITYTAQQVSALSCFRGYVDPSAPGPSANLTIDDRYSRPLDITFPFSFFGSSYNKVIASTNGFVSFDTSKTLTFSHFGILKNGTGLSSTSGVPEDLPSALYDKALIMGPYHDLDPNNSTSAQQIKYEVIGTAPYRKWILSYYNVPLYTTACLNLSKNTHQIVLYETLGIVEIFIYDKEICPNWNDGRAMIGMQDFTKTSAIMAPGRQASSAPWGSKGMDESWRFIPASGASLFKRVELYTLSGTFVTTGTTSNIGNNLLGVSFPNVCPPNSGQTYIVKSFYKNPSNLANEIIGIDTINVNRGDPVRADIASAGCFQGSNGSITVTSPLGATYEYSIDGVNWRSSTIFQVVAGSYILSSRIKGTNCISTKTFTVVADPLAVTVLNTSTECFGPPSGSITMTPGNGQAPYQYSIDSGNTFHNNNYFDRLDTGTYHVVVVDANGCTFSITIIIGRKGPMADAVATNTICGQAATGTITIIPISGDMPFSYSINDGPYQASNVFTNLSAGTYLIRIKDTSSCPSALRATVNSDVVLKINAAIIMPRCHGDSDASFTVSASLGKPPYEYSLNNNFYQKSNLFSNLKSGSYFLHVKDSLGCIKDTTIIVQEPNIVNETFITIPATTCFSNDGQVTVKANGGTIPYEYSIDSGATYQAGNVFTLNAGIYTIKVRDAHGCSANIPELVPALNNIMKVDLGPDKNICSGSSTVLSANTNPKAIAFSWSPATGLNDSTAATPIASPSDTSTYILNTRSTVCIGSDTIRLNVLHKPVAYAGLDTIICYKTAALLHGTAINTSGTVSYLWLPANDVVNPNAQVTLVYPRDIRTQTYRLQVSDNYGCNFKSFDEVKVTMNPPVPAFAGNDTVAAMNVPHQLFGSGGIQYFWSPVNLLDSSTKQNPIAKLYSDTRFFLIVRDTLGCIGNSSVLVKVYKDVTYYIPNAFSPNGDGLNDRFKGVAPGIQRTDYFRVYNRLGKLMYQSNDVTKGWDGKFLGVEQPSAVYVWVLKGLDKFGKIIQMKGIVTLIR